MEQSAAEGCECCAFLVDCIEWELNISEHDPEAIEIAPVNFDWWGVNPAEDSGAYLCIAPEGSGPLEVELEFFTMRGKFVNL
jgi:hypothetical protein